jgi:hypothetical protein
MNPFKISTRRVKIPHLRPTSRATFVAPIFPLPAFVISNLTTLRLIKRPKGIEARRYAATKSAMKTSHMSVNSEKKTEKTFLNFDRLLYSSHVIKRLVISVVLLLATGGSYMKALFIASAT